MQVIQGTDIRLLYPGTSTDRSENIVFAMKGAKNDQNGISDKISELVETSEIVPATPAAATPGAVPAMWDEWDM